MSMRMKSRPEQAITCTLATDGMVAIAPRAVRASRQRALRRLRLPTSAMVSLRDPLGHKLLQVPEIPILKTAFGEMSGGIVKILSARAPMAASLSQDICYV